MLTWPPNSQYFSPIEHLWDVLDIEVPILTGPDSKILVTDNTVQLQGFSRVHVLRGQGSTILLGRM